MKPRRSLASRKPLPEAATRLRRVFPEVWVRYQLLAAARGYDDPQAASRAQTSAEPAASARKPPRRVPRSG